MSEINLPNVPYEKLPESEIQALVAKAQAGDEAARNRVIMHVYRWVAQIAIRSAQRAGRLDLVEDLIQAALVGASDTRTGGVTRAIETFDPSLGYAFLTYAASAVRNEIRIMFYASISACASAATMQRITRIRRMVEELERRHGGEQPSTEEIQAAYREAGKRPPKASTIEKALAFTEIAPETLDVSGSTEDDLIDRVDRDRAKARLRRSIAQLPPRYQKVVAMVGEGESNVAIGEAIGASRTRAYQIANKAMGRLKTAVELDGGGA